VALVERPGNAIVGYKLGLVDGPSGRRTGDVVGEAGGLAASAATRADHHFHRKRPMRRRGFALMAALWLLIAISTVSLELSVMARGRRLATINVLESVRAAAAAESGIEHARAHLVRTFAQGGTGETWNDPLSVLDPWHRAGSEIRDSVAMAEGATYRVHVT